MTHPDPKAALEEILERHKGSEEPSSGHPEADAFLACRECGYKPSPCDAARVAKAMLGIMEALEALHKGNWNVARAKVINFRSFAREALARAAQDLEPK